MRLLLKKWYGECSFSYTQATVGNRVFCGCRIQRIRQGYFLLRIQNSVYGLTSGIAGFYFKSCDTDIREKRHFLFQFTLTGILTDESITSLGRHIVRLFKTRRKIDFRELYIHGKLLRSAFQPLRPMLLWISSDKLESVVADCLQLPESLFRPYRLCKKHRCQ